MVEENVELARTGLEAFNRGDLETVFSLLDPEVVAFIPVELPNEGTYYGHDGFRQMLQQWNEPWEEFEVEPEDFIARGDHVVVPVRQRARGRGSGIEVEARLAYVFEIRNARLVRWELYADRREALRSVGLPGESAPAG
jgi:ketosteroid isomerase-like protein